jgi:hypothetical protein
MKTKIISMLAAILFFSTIIAQENPNSVTVKVQNLSGNSVTNAQVYFCNANNCQNSSTDNTGKAYFTLPDLPTAIIAYDPAGIYGAQAVKIDQSRAVYNVSLPNKPINPQEAGRQFDCLLNRISTLYGYFDDGIFIGEALKAINAGAGSLGGTALPSLGVPGIFSINPIPTVGYDGKLGLQVSGLLVDNLIQIWQITQPLQGKRAYYQYYPSL